MARSPLSRFVAMYFKIIGTKKTFIDKEKNAAFIQSQRKENAKPYVFPANAAVKSSIAKETVHDMDVYVLNQKGDANQKQILYLHGGAYISQPVKQHWIFLDTVARQTNSVAILPIYPKTPNHQYQEAFDKVLAVYEGLLKTTEAQNIVIMGDSAGGGFSLALAQTLLKKSLPQPGNIILLSPWLDITMKNPRIPALEAKDPMLGAYGLAEIGKVWAGDSEPNDFMLSPINGAVNGLAKITLFVGTHELFLPDARRFKKLAMRQRVDINYFEFEKMNHAFMLYPIPEAKKATARIIKIINKES